MSAATSCRDFANVKTNGKIAMKLAPGERLVGVETCRRRSGRAAGDRRPGKGIRFFPSTTCASSSSRSSTGVRGIRAGPRAMR